MATTSPDGLRTPDPGDPYNLVPDLQTLANDTQDALILRANAYPGSVSDRTSFTPPQDGILWQDTDGIGMIWKSVSGAWVPALWHWSGTTTQMNSFAAPNGFTWTNTTNNSDYVRLGGSWRGGPATVSPASGSSLSAATGLSIDPITNMVSGSIFATRSSWTGGGSTTVATLSVNPPSAIGISVALNGAGAPYVAFGQISTGGSVIVINSPPNAQTWLASISVNFRLSS